MGHAKGDEVLQKVAQVIADSIGSDDILVRWGGEEFVVIVDGADEKSLIDVGQKINRNVVTHTSETELSVTVSIGGTIFKQQDTQDSMFSRSDKALYQAKGQGRNTFILAAQ